MSRIKLFIVAVLSTLLAVPQMATAQQQEEPDINELAETEALRLEKLLDLEVWQSFYVDSTLKHDYAAMMAELDELKASKVSNSSIYMAVQDKWMDKIDARYKAIFNEKQWAIYMKSGAAKAQKLRDKRRLKKENGAK